MKSILDPMWHLVAANAQVGLSYFWLIGYFAVLVLTGLGKFPTNVLGDLTPVTVMVVSFWFARQRTTTDPPPVDNSTTTAPQAKAP